MSTDDGKRRTRRLIAMAVVMGGLLGAPPHGLPAVGAAEHARALLDRAIESYEQGRYDDAGHRLRRALAASPAPRDERQIVFLLGVTSYRQGRYDQAVEFLSRAVQIDPRWGAAHAWLGEAHRAKGDTRQALGAYRTAAGLDPARWAYHSRIGRFHVDLGEHRQAIDPLLEALRLHPAPDDAKGEHGTDVKARAVYSALGDAYVGLGDLERAATYYRKEFTSAEEAAGVFHAAAERRKARDPEQALKLYRKAALVAPLHEPHRHHRLARFLIGLGRKEEAIGPLRTAARLAGARHPRSYRVEVGVFEDLGRVYFDLGQYARAIQTYETLVGLERPGTPGPRNALANLGIAYAVLGDYAKAAATLARGLDAHPDETAYREWLVVASYGTGGWQAAESVWRRVRPGGRSRDLQDLVFRGVWNLAERAEARRIFYAALTHYSLAFTVTHALEKYVAGVEDDRLGEIQGRVARAYRGLPLKPLPPARALRHATDAEQSLARRDWHRTVEGYRLAVEIAPWWPEAYYNLGLALAVSPTWLPGAIREMRKYLELEPNGRHAARAREKLRLWQASVDRLVGEHGNTLSADVPFLIGPDREDR